MPYLTRQNSTDSTASESEQLARSEAAKPISSPVSFIPAQIDGLCGTSSALQKKSSWQIFVTDARQFLQHAGTARSIWQGLRQKEVWQQRFGSYDAGVESTVHVLLAFAQLGMLICGSFIFCFMPASIFVPYVILMYGCIRMLSWPLNGSRVVLSTCHQLSLDDDHTDERWIYINGSTCSNYSLRNQCALITRIFGRPVVGVHDQTRGLVLDVLSALAIRAFNQPTSTTRDLTSQIRDACLNNSVRKVVILGHGTGAIHVSLSLDILLADLPNDVLCKLEIYTFGSAASHLSNPLVHLESLKAVFSPTATTQANFTRSDGSIKSPVKATLASLGHRIEDHERVIPHIEHYASTNDIFARVGVLYNVKNVLDNRYCGRVFMLKEGVRGLPFGSFKEYINALFPHDRSLVHADCPRYLDELVNVDAETAEQREFTAMGVALPLKSVHHQPSRDVFTSPLPFSFESSDVSSRTMFPSLIVGGTKRASWGTAGAMGIDGVGKARVGAKECEGKTVRQLSRLWRYAGGARPVGEGVPVLNGGGY